MTGPPPDEAAAADDGPAARVADSAGDVDPNTLDVVATTTGVLPDGRYWLLMEFAFPFPPPPPDKPALIRVRMHADGVGQPVARVAVTANLTAVAQSAQHYVDIATGAASDRGSAGYRVL